jgi:integrase
MAYAERRDGHLTGFWYGEVGNSRQDGQSRLRRRFETRREAEGWEEYVKKVGSEPPGFVGATNGLLFSEVAAECARAGGPTGKWKRGRSISDANRRYKAVAYFGHMPVAAIETTHIDAWVQELEKQPGKAGEYLDGDTINRYLAALSGILSWAHKRKIIKGKPAIPWQPKTGGRILWLTEAQEDALTGNMLAHALPHMMLTVQVLCASGMRWGEFASLEPQHVTMDANGTHAWIALDRTKTDTPRDIPIDAHLGRDLARMLRDGTRPSYMDFRLQLAKSVEAVGIDSSFTIHCLRHTTATRLAQKNVNISKIKAFMGHKAIQTTERYIHLNKRSLLEVANNLSPRRGEMVSKDHNQEPVSS